MVVVGFFVLVGLVIRKIIGGTKRQAQDGAALGGASYEIPTAKAMIGQAAKLAEAGDYRGAFKSAYLASIAYLDEIRVLRFERSRTNWEYLRELKSGGHERPHRELCPLTLDFDRKIYGRESCEQGLPERHRCLRAPVERGGEMRVSRDALVLIGLFI